ncbi:MAG: DUF1127 domain-containing protein [Pseudomonadota bacterium]
MSINANAISSRSFSVSPLALGSEIGGALMRVRHQMSQRRKQRIAARSLTRLSDKALRDIGLSRGEALGIVGGGPDELSD